MNKEILDAQIRSYCLDIILQLCKGTGIWTVPGVMISNSKDYANVSSVSACYDLKHQCIVLFQDKLFWHSLENVVAHEWWHAVQWLLDRRTVRKHQAFLRHLKKQNTDDFVTCVLEDLSPVEVAARIFERQRQHTAARNYLLRHRHDYRDLQNGDPWDIYHRLEQIDPLLLIDSVRTLMS